jgi:hypothetical protein
MLLDSSVKIGMGGISRRRLRTTGVLPHSRVVGGRQAGLEAGGARGGGSDRMGGDSESETIERRHVAGSNRVAHSTSTRPDTV